MADLRPHRKDGAPLLAIEGLSIDFHRRKTAARVVDRVSIDIWPGEIVGLIGETGSGKSLTASAILRALPYGAAIAGGAIAFDGQPLLALSDREMRALRGDAIVYVPQDAARALNPLLTIGRQVGEPCEIHRGAPLRAAWDRAVETLASVGIGEPRERARDYPHQFSGGMQQRAMIATALTLDPRLIIADEPTSSLDVTVQAQILALLGGIRDRTGAAMLFISHDLAIVASLCDWVYVMHRGVIVEDGSVAQIFETPQADYTRMLLDATPDPGRSPGRRHA
jgi:ABC-type dipeptide/oligopeptide/nickel transport system ATPase component